MEYRDRADAARSSNPDLRILAARPLFGEDDAGPPAESLKDARAAGFGALSCPADLWPSDESRRDVQELSARCAKAGLALFLELDLKGFPIDHPIVERHPDHFAIRREGPREQPVDPRRPLPATGEALR
jgi:starch synthase (maltosyl-transferring)